MAAAALAVVPGSGALAANPIIITQAKAVSGNVTPGDAAGFPITLTQPGAYELGGNLSPPPGLSGIQIAAADITIDFAGFRLFGNGTGQYGVAGPYPGLTIKNGTVERFRQDGVSATDSSVLDNGRFWTIDNMRVLYNTERGIFCREFCRVIRSSVIGNGKAGASMGASAHVEGSVLNSNNFYGIFMDSGTAIGNTLMYNGREGLSGAQAVGYGNNTLSYNNVATGGPQVVGQYMIKMQPNACFGNCPP